MLEKKNKYSLGALKDKIDNRDYKIADYFVKDILQIPSLIDYTSQMQSVRDQGQKGSCVAFALSAIKEYEEKIDIKENLIFSPDWIYLQRPDLGIDGMYPRDAMDFLVSNGDCLELSLPYSLSNASRITQEKIKILKDEAYNYRISAYARINNVDELKQSIYEHGPAFIAVALYDSFFNTNSDGLVPLPDTSKEGCVGGHALTVVGYDDSKNLFKVKNSWGTSFGDKGYCYLSYDYISLYAYDMWNLVDTKSKNIKSNWFLNMWNNIIEWFKEKNHLIWFIIVGLMTIIICFLTRR